MSPAFRLARFIATLLGAAAFLCALIAGFAADPAWLLLAAFAAWSAARLWRETV
jgi:hypothetical protein